MSYLIKVTRKAAFPLYIGAVMVAEDEYENTAFRTLDEAKDHACPTEDVAVSVVGTLPDLKKSAYSIIEVE